MARLSHEGFEAELLRADAQEVSNGAAWRAHGPRLLAVTSQFNSVLDS